MISNGKELFKFIDQLLVPHGFIKKREVWYLKTIDCICFFKIEKSTYGSGYYGHVMGCFLKRINKDKTEFPEYYKCQLRYNIGEFVDKDVIKRAFSLNNSDFKNYEREELIRNLLEKYMIPFLYDISTEKGIMDSINKYHGLEYWMNIDLKKAIDMPYDD